jgi:hypothetical protein
MDAYQLAVELDRRLHNEMIKNMTPEQINRFCFENGFEVPEPHAIEMIKQNAAEKCHD